MYSLKKFLTLVGLSLAVISFSSPAAADKIRIGFVLPELSNEAILDLDIGARARAEQLGNVEILTNGSYSGEEQAAAVENYIAAGVDILAYDTIDAAAVGPAIVKANEAGIPVICVFSCGSTGEHVSFMSADWTENGRKVGRWMSKTLGKDGIVAHVEGNPSTVAGIELTQGFTEGLAENGITNIVAKSPAMNFAREEGLAAATDMITANPPLQGIYGIIDDVAMGALQAARAAGRMDILIGGHNGTCEALQSILKGELDFTVMLFSQALGAAMVDLALKAHAGEEVADFVPMPTSGMDTAWANGILDGTREDPPANIAPEIKKRLEAAKAGCS
jgi:ribose transport system substrate-binding protein